MSLKGLSKSIPTAILDTDMAADSFIGAAKVLHNGTEPKSTGVRFKRVNLSLDAKVDAELDRLSLLPRDFRASRSDVVKAAVALLSTQTEENIIDMLRSLNT